jgi:hypothetical protein
MKTRMMRFLPLAVPILLVLAGCPAVLTSSLAPDLVLTLGRFNPTSLATVRGAVGGTLALPVAVSDLTGRAVSGAFSVAFTLSADSSLATTGDNTDLGTQTVTGGSEQVVSLVVPVSAAAGSYTLFGVLSPGAAPDAAAGNDTVAIDVILGANSPDLTIDASLPLARIQPEGAMTASCKVTNAGYALIASGASFTVTCAATIGTAVAVPVGTTTVTLSGPLYAGDFVTCSVSVAMPSIAAMGSTPDAFTGASGSFVFTADAGNAIAESNEANNTDSVAVTAPALKPDVSVSSVALPADAAFVKPGAPMQAAVTLRNMGYAVAPVGYTVTLFVDLDGNSAYDSGTDLVINTWTSTPAIPFDPAGSNNKIIVTVPEGLAYPSTVPTSGSYRLGAVVTGVSGETVTGNNTGVSSTMPFVSSAVDLALDKMTTSLASVIPTTGGSIPLSLRLYNGGSDAFSGTFVIHFYGSDALTLTPTLDLGTATITTSIPAKGRVQTSATVTVPAAAVGFYTLYWNMDSTGLVAEINESNNTVTSANNCFVYFIVSDGAGSLGVAFMAVKPRGAASVSTSLYVQEYTVTAGTWNYDTWFAWSSTTAPGSVYGTVQPSTISLVSGTTFGFQVYSGSAAGAPYALRIVPPYVTSVPLEALPDALGTNDSWEPNDTQAKAKALGASQSPLFGFLNGYSRYSSDYDYDYYTFTMP